MASTEITIRQPDTAEALAANDDATSKADALVVNSEHSHRFGLELISAIVTMQRGVKDLFADAKRDANKAHKSVVAAEKKLLVPLDAAKRMASGKLDVYEAEQRRIQQEAQRAAEKKVREAEEERQLQDAIDAEEAGDPEQADAILNEPVAPPVVHVSAPIAQVQGVSSRTTWHAEVTNLLQLVQFVAEHPEFINYLQHNGSALNQTARAQQAAMNVPGVKAVSETTRAVRTA